MYQHELRLSDGEHRTDRDRFHYGKPIRLRFPLVAVSCPGRSCDSSPFESKIRRRELTTLLSSSTKRLNAERQPGYIALLFLTIEEFYLPSGPFPFPRCPPSIELLSPEFAPSRLFPYHPLPCRQYFHLSQCHLDTTLRSSLPPFTNPTL